MIKPSHFFYSFWHSKVFGSPDSNIQNTIDASNDIEGGIVDENVIHENVQSPNSGSYFDYFSTFISYAYSAIFGSDFVVVAQTSEAFPWLHLFPFIPSILKYNQSLSGPITVSSSASSRSSGSF